MLESYDEIAEYLLFIFRAPYLYIWIPISLGVIYRLFQRIFQECGPVQVTPIKATAPKTTTATTRTGNKLNSAISTQTNKSRPPTTKKPVLAHAQKSISSGAVSHAVTKSATPQKTVAPMVKNSNTTTRKTTQNNLKLTPSSRQTQSTTMSQEKILVKLICTEHIREELFHSFRDYIGTLKQFEVTEDEGVLLVVTTAVTPRIKQYFPKEFDPSTSIPVVIQRNIALEDIYGNLISVSMMEAPPKPPSFKFDQANLLKAITKIEQSCKPGGSL